MALRFQKRIKIAPGLRVNLSKTGVSASVGKPGATVNIGKNGVQGTAGIPGTGLSYKRKFGKSGQASEGAEGQQAGTRGAWLLAIGVLAAIAALVYWLA